MTFSNVARNIQENEYDGISKIKLLMRPSNSLKRNSHWFLSSKFWTIRAPGISKKWTEKNRPSWNQASTLGNSTPILKFTFLIFTWNESFCSGIRLLLFHCIHKIFSHLLVLINLMGTSDDWPMAVRRDIGFIFSFDRRGK